MININNDKELEIYLDTQLRPEPECPLCGETVESLYWWKHGRREDLIEQKCDNCHFTFSDAEAKVIIH